MQGSSTEVSDDSRETLQGQWLKERKADRMAYTQWRKKIKLIPSQSLECFDTEIENGVNV